jgi:DNA-binding NtrC family response regulator
MSTPILIESEFQPYAPEVLAGEGPSVTRLRLQIARISPHFRTVLVTGETGSGKETVAREMVRLSGAAPKPCSVCAMQIASFAQGQEPESLSGVLFLKGLDKLEPSLQENLVTRLREIQRETRIIVSSEADLRGLLATGRLRPSLASRVGSLEVRVGSLRDRPEDLEALAGAMLKRHGGEGWFGPEAVEVMQRHGWPGNLAELWSVVRHVAGLKRVIEPGDLPELKTAEMGNESGTRLDEVMHRHVFDVLRRCSGNKLRAAELLGISRSTLYRMLEVAAEASVLPDGPTSRGAVTS